MAFNEQYRRQVALLIRVIPFVAEENCFALKGGTAINLFVRDMPRLSVDIDLTYLPVQARSESLAAIDTALKRISQRVQQTIPGAAVTEQQYEGAVAKLLVRADHVQIKIEVTPVLRGCVYLSGGEQQMVAIGRALMANPRLLMLDEPSLGIAPIMAETIYSAVKRLSYGFSSEALFDRVASWQIYVRGRANVNSDFSGLTRSYSTTGELQALSDRFGVGRNFGIGSLGYFWFIPLVRAQYFERASKLVKDPIFDTRDQVLRAGPVISMNFIPQPAEDADPNKPPPAPKWLLNLTYSWYKDFYSGRTFEHFNPSFTYNFTDNIGLTFGYDRGQIEQTGKKVDLMTVGLSVKN